MVWRYVIRHGLKILFLGILSALAVYASVSLATQGSYGLAILPVAAAGLIMYLLLSPRRYPLRWLLPGVFFLTVMVLYPIGYTFVGSFTNLGTGHMLPKEQAIAQIVGRTYAPPGAKSYSFTAFQDEAGAFAFLLQSPDETILYLDGQGSAVSLTDPRIVDEDGDGRADRVDGYHKLTAPELVQALPRLQGLTIEFAGQTLALVNISEFQAQAPQYSYDASTETLTNLETGKTYTPIEGIFTAKDGEEIYPGYRVWVGIANYVRLVLNPQISGPFARVFLWTILFATFSVLLTFAFGLFLAVLLNDPHLRFRTVYRVLVIVPYALPAFVTILVWRGMLNQNFGIINHTLVALFGGGARVPWLEDALWAKVSCILLNLWLGYPYMMIVSLGALQSIPGSLYEASRVDGATWWQQFRKITLPLLLMPLAPLLVGSFAFNFNNFTLIYLLTGGTPPIPGAQTPAGATDILISYTYRLSFEGQRGNQLGLASAVSVIVFLIIATISAVNFRMTGTLEELTKNV